MTDKYKNKAAGGIARRRKELHKFRKNRKYQKKEDEIFLIKLKVLQKESNQENNDFIRNFLPLFNGNKILRYLMARHGRRCVYCGVGVHLRMYVQEPKATLDHLIPRAKGGSNEISNLVVACRECNGKKADMMPGDFMRLIWGEFLERCPHEINLKD